MSLEQQLKNQHLLGRAGFGVSYRDIPKLEKISTHKLLKKIMETSAAPYKPIVVKNSCVLDITMERYNDKLDGLSKEAIQQKKLDTQKEFNLQSNRDIQQMTIDWMDEMAYSEARLREKMSLFWHGHFACVVGNSFYQQYLLDVIRRNALAHFGTLLTEVCKSASMLSFLNNQQNRKQHPNENFARELMELFTMGRSHYTEQDVKEAARAFTGWQFEKNGDFKFNNKIHDDGTKTILGHTGNFNGDDVMNIILQQKQTAIFITRKLYVFFVNDMPDEMHVNQMAEAFYSSNYDIAALMYDIFSSDWFYDEKNRGIHIKSPVEYVAGIRAFLPMEIQNDEVQVLIERILGQSLFNPPNVAGWPGGKSWIDSSSLMFRLKIPSLITGDEAIALKPKTNDDIQMGRKETFDTSVKNKKAKKPANGPYQIHATIDWATLQRALDEEDTTLLLQKLKTLLLQTPADSIKNETLAANIKSDNPLQFIERATIAIMSTPEYQLC